jgi:hypothetical protein
MAPNHSTGTRVERGGIVCRGHQHHSVYYNRSDLKPTGVARVKNPLRA